MKSYFFNKLTFLQKPIQLNVFKLKQPALTRLHRGDIGIPISAYTPILLIVELRLLSCAK